MTAPHFIRLDRTDGRPAVIRVDAITALLPGIVKGVPEVTMQLGPTVILNVSTPLDEIVKLMGQATGRPPQIMESEKAAA